MLASRPKIKALPTTPITRGSVRNKVRNLGLVASIAVAGCINSWTEYTASSATVTDAADSAQVDGSNDGATNPEVAVDTGPADIVDAALPDVVMVTDVTPDVVQPVDNGMADAGVDVVADNGDSGRPDTGTDTAPVDTGSGDTGPADAGNPDVGTPDVGTPDAGPCRITSMTINGGRVLNLGSTGPIDVRFASTGNCADRLFDVGDPSNRTIDAANYAAGGSDFPVSPFTISAPDGTGTMRTSLNMYGVLGTLTSYNGVGVTASFDLNGGRVSGATRIYFGRPTFSVNPRGIGSGSYFYSFLAASAGLSCTSYFFTSSTSSDTLLFNHGSETPCTTLGAPCGEGEVCGLSRVRPLPVTSLSCVNTDLVTTAPTVIAAGTSVTLSTTTSTALRTAVPSGSANTVRLRVVCAQTASMNGAIYEGSIGR